MSLADPACALQQAVLQRSHSAKRQAPCPCVERSTPWMASFTNIIGTRLGFIERAPNGVVEIVVEGVQRGWAIELEELDAPDLLGDQH